MNNIVEQGYRAAMKAVIDESLWTGQLDDPGIRQAPIKLALSFVRSTSAKADLLSSGIRWVPKRTGHWNDCVQRFGNGNYWPIVANSYAIGENVARMAAHDPFLSLN